MSKFSFSLAFPLVLLVAGLLMSCAGMKHAVGPLYTDTPLPNDSVGRVILYKPVQSRSNTNIYETMVSLNTMKMAPINIGGYHVYDLHPGVHVLNLKNGQPYEETIVLRVRPGDTTYIRYEYSTRLITAAYAKSELHDVKLEYVTSAPQFPINLKGKSMVARRSTLLDLEYTQSENFLDDFFNGTPGTYTVDPMMHDFRVKLAYVTGNVYARTIHSTDYIDLLIDAKSDCIYLVSYTENNNLVRFHADETCTAMSAE